MWKFVESSSQANSCQESLAVVALPKGFMLVLQNTIPETWHLCNEWSGFAAFLSSSLALNIRTHVTHECVGLANKEEHPSLLSSLSVLPQAMTEDRIIMLGHEAAALQFKCYLPMNAIGMHVNRFFASVLDVTVNKVMKRTWKLFLD